MITGQSQRALLQEKQGMSGEEVRALLIVIMVLVSRMARKALMQAVTETDDLRAASDSTTA